MDRESVRAIAQEAFTRGRVYAKGGEKKNPADAFEELEAFVDRFYETNFKETSGCESHLPISTPHCPICRMEELAALRARHDQLRNRIHGLAMKHPELAADIGKILEDE